MMTMLMMMQIIALGWFFGSAAVIVVGACKKSGHVTKIGVFLLLLEVIAVVLVCYGLVLGAIPLLF